MHIMGCKQVPGGPSLSLPLPLPSFPLPSLPRPLLNPSLPLPAFRSRPPEIQLGGLGGTVSSPSRVWGGAPAEIEFGSF